MNVHEYVRTQSSHPGLACQPSSTPACMRNQRRLASARLYSPDSLTVRHDSMVSTPLARPGKRRLPARPYRSAPEPRLPVARTTSTAERSPSTTEPFGRRLPNGSVPSHPIDCRKTSWGQPRSASEPPVVPLDDHSARPDRYRHGSASSSSSASVRRSATVAGAFPGRRRSPPARPLPAR